MILIYSLIPLTSFMILMFTNTFISIEMNLMNFKMINIPISLILDWVSCLFLTTVMLISSMIILFSIFYIPKSEHKKFSLMLLMFVLSMSILILADNIIFILLGWDSLGLSSYILVIYYQNFSSASSGTITLMSNRVGDIMILSSIALMSINFNWSFSMNNNYTILSMILLITAAITKSAQFPFSAWLPAAMAAPTPISALVHSSTLVTAGVFLLIRLMNNPHPISMSLLLIISSITSIYASFSANWEQDMKKIVALSTLSQIAMMMFAISLKSSLMAFFHLIIHALFKSTMFLCVGVLIHNYSYQDMRMMGINSLNSPLTLSILGISSFSLMGLPFMSGFFSKDSIMELMMLSKMNSLLSIFMLMSLGLTISYSIRMMKISSSLYSKSKPDLFIHSSNYALFPIMCMAPMSIFLGSIMMWMFHPFQMFMIPKMLKFSIPMVIILSTIMGIYLNFNNYNYMKMGKPSINLWFLHNIFALIFNNFSKHMNLMYHNDKMWQESYGAQNFYSLIKYTSYFPMNFSSFPLMLILLIIILPFIIIK